MNYDILIKADVVDAEGTIFTEKCLKDLAEQSGGALVWDPVAKELHNNPDLTVAAVYEPVHEEITKREGNCVRLVHKFRMLRLETDGIC